MGLDGAIGEPELSCDAHVSAALGHQCEGVSFSRGDRRQWVALSARTDQPDDHFGSERSYTMSSTGSRGAGTCRW
jgi:hypothetical protein